jgi:hypothetical protein
MENPRGFSGVGIVTTALSISFIEKAIRRPPFNGQRRVMTNTDVFLITEFYHKTGLFTNQIMKSRSGRSGRLTEYIPKGIVQKKKDKEETDDEEIHPI